MDATYRPHVDIRIKAAFVLDDPFPDIPGLQPLKHTEIEYEEGRVSDTED